MTTKRLFLVFALTLLFGCATTPRSMADEPCNQGTCFIDVTVNDCRVSVDPTDRHIQRGNMNPVIHWKMSVGSFMAFRYSDQGVVFKQNTNGQFHSPGQSFMGKNFTWIDKNDTQGKFPYTINVVRRSNGEACPPFDPSVVND